MSDLFNNHHISYRPSERRVYSVSELTRDIRFVLEEHFPPLWVEGEISNFKQHSSGHLYFSLKDAEAQINCVMWRGRSQGMMFHPADGMKVLVMGHLTVYERQGRYQLDVQFLQPAGRGELQLAFERLKRQLESEGLFNPEFKKPLPPFPETIGVVTSPTGAAIRDIESIVHRRFPGVQIILVPVRVQGEGAADEIAQGLADLNAYGKVDVIIVGRGGGSLEDLWAFNEEIVVRAIFNSHIPVVSAVGHEIDFSISDFVADVRAPTPSAAAEMVVRDRGELRQTVIHHGIRIRRSVEAIIQIYRQRLEGLQRSYAFRQPWNRIREYRIRVDDWHRQIENQQANKLQEARLNLSRLSARLIALNPKAVLNRGYSITTRIKNNEVVRCAAQVAVQEALRIQLAEGVLRATVDHMEGKSESAKKEY